MYSPETKYNTLEDDILNLLILFYGQFLYSIAKTVNEIFFIYLFRSVVTTKLIPITLFMIYSGLLCA